MPAKKAAKKTPTKKVAKKAAQKIALKKPKASAANANIKKTRKKVASVTTQKTLKPSNEAIAQQAYLNYLQRVQNHLPGDSHGDWIAAEKQLEKS